MEKILTPTLDRFIVLPVQYPKLKELYDNALASFWTHHNIDLTGDEHDWNNKLNENERYFISNVLAFFAASDGIVNENLAARFYTEVQIAEARLFYGYQMAIEGIHAETYGLLIETYIKNEEERSKLFHAVTNIPIVKKKAEWAMKWIGSTASFAERLVAFAAVEGIFFSSSFCSIYWLKKRNLMPGLSFSNEYISRDEGMHCDFAVELYSLLENKLPMSRIREIIEEAVEIECEFACESIPVDLIGMNKVLMSQYIKFVADRLLTSFGAQKTYKVKNPFDFMDLLSLEGKSNFFEKKVSEYKMAGVGVGSSGNKISFSEDF